MKYWLPPLITVAVTLGLFVVLTKDTDCAYQPIWKSVGGTMVYACP